MSARLAVAILAVALAAPTAAGYIHFPPATLPKMCQVSNQIRVLKVEKFDKDKGVVIFTEVETLKGGKSSLSPLKHVLRPSDAAGPILDWLKGEKAAVMFSIEGETYGQVGCAYVFVDENCYSADYNASGQYWQFIRTEPARSACYHGSVEKLRELVKDVLAGKEVKVPTKEPAAKEDWDKREKEVNKVLTENRKP